MNTENNTQKYICEKCGKEHDGSYGSGRFCSEHCRRVWSGKHAAHNGNHKCNFPKKKKSKFGTWYCKFCDQIFETSHQLWKHKHECHQELLNGPHGKGQIAWNKGLTSKTNDSLKKVSQKLCKKYESGEIIPVFKGKHHSDISKKKMSESALRSNHQRVCKQTLPYLCKDGTVVRLDSSYERILAKIFDDNDIKWIRPKPLDWYSKDGIKHHYFSDFYLVDYDLYIDPKNDYCFKVQAEKIQYLTEHYYNCIFLHKDELTKEKIFEILKEQ